MGSSIVTPPKYQSYIGVFTNWLTLTNLTFESDGPLLKVEYPSTKDTPKHSKFKKALKHQNKPRYIRSRVLSRQYK